MPLEQLNAIIASALLLILVLIGASLVVYSLNNRVSPKRRFSYFATGVVLLLATCFIYIYRNPQAGVILSAFATIILALFAGWQIYDNRLLRGQTRKMTERERKERLLKEIVDWAIEINTSDLTTEIPDVWTTQTLEVMRGNKRLKRGIPLAKSAYIRSIAKGNFDGELLERIDKLIIEHKKGILLDQHMSNEEGFEKAFGQGGDYLWNR